jgi:hypothetical protein
MDASPAARRWYQPTPAWLVWGAAVAVGILYTQEHSWFFAFEHNCRGLMVLLAVAVLGTVAIALPAWILLALVFRRRVQFGLKTMLMFVTLCTVVCSWLGIRIRQARRQAATVAAIREKFHANVMYVDWRSWPVVPPPQVPEPLIKSLGVDFFADVVSLEFQNLQLTEAELADLDETLPRVDLLVLSSDQVTDASLTHLEQLKHLKWLKLCDTKVTKEGLKKLQKALPNCSIEAVPFLGPWWDKPMILDHAAISTEK